MMGLGLFLFVILAYRLRRIESSDEGVPIRKQSSMSTDVLCGRHLLVNGLEVKTCNILAIVYKLTINFSTCEGQFRFQDEEKRDWIHCGDEGSFVFYASLAVRVLPIHASR